MTRPRDRSNAVVPFRAGPRSVLGGYGAADASLLARLDAPIFGEVVDDDDFIDIEPDYFAQPMHESLEFPAPPAAAEVPPPWPVLTPELYAWLHEGWQARRREDIRDFLCNAFAVVAWMLACIWGGIEVDRWFFENNDPPAAMRSGELVARLENNQCVANVWASAGSGKGGHFDTVLDSGNSTGGVTLTRADAETAGLDVGSLWFVFPYRSVSGLGWEAHTSLRQVRIGGAVLRNVPVDVISETGGVNESLIGFALLKRLHFRMRGDSCVLSW